MDLKEYAVKAQGLLEDLADSHKRPWLEREAQDLWNAVSGFLHEPFPELPHPIRWTRKAPDRPGWWLKTAEAERTKPILVRVREVNGVWEYGDYFSRVDKCSPETLWSGPIPEPLPPEEPEKTTKDFAEVVHRKHPEIAADVDQRHADEAYLIANGWDHAMTEDDGCDTWSYPHHLRAAWHDLIKREHGTQHYWDRGEAVKLQRQIDSLFVPAERPWRSEPPDVPGKWERRVHQTFEFAVDELSLLRTNDGVEWRLVSPLPEPEEHKLVKAIRAFLDGDPSALFYTKEMLLSQLTAALQAKGTR